MFMILFSFYLTSQQKADLERLSRRTDVPMAEHLRQAIQWWVCSGYVSGRVA